MLTFKEWRNLNESITGTSFNLGVARPATVGGVVGATGASDWAEKWKLIEAKKMKKKMFGKEEAPEDEEDADLDMDDEDLDAEEPVDDEGGDEDVDLDDEGGDEDLDDEGGDEEEITDDDISGLEGGDDEDMGGGDDVAVSAKKKKGPPMEITLKMKKGMKDNCKKCGKMMSKCSCKHMKKGAKKKMTKEEVDWWKSVASMVGTDPDHRNWDGISVREDSLLPEIDPNALALAQVPQPGDPGYAPQTRIGQV